MDNTFYNIEPIEGEPDNEDIPEEVPEVENPVDPVDPTDPERPEDEEDVDTYVPIYDDSDEVIGTMLVKGIYVDARKGIVISAEDITVVGGATIIRSVAMDVDFEAITQIINLANKRRD